MGPNSPHLESLDCSGTPGLTKQRSPDPRCSALLRHLGPGSGLLECSRLGGFDGRRFNSQLKHSLTRHDSSTPTLRLSAMWTELIAGTTSSLQVCESMLGSIAAPRRES
ncbi:hypothetical protein CgunFtcFv8_001692 [Champsocephalus gunnari]|uniref:Uncharacterized protein n=1 Tax=Champsocephalus gunnari TaxID=52237 RepID=A0AAN8CLG6_CHAGU|nr:hypothetical protein CgunFtcFv8_001692 [Champsocephalus gunnari]